MLLCGRLHNSILEEGRAGGPVRPLPPGRRRGQAGPGRDFNEMSPRLVSVEGVRPAVEGQEEVGVAVIVAEDSRVVDIGVVNIHRTMGGRAYSRFRDGG